ncbi:hypothetical protein O181_007628 [Austropuccinia psidii MF-1]|uniref:Uncharacterized protein n=1 Tax=Austropuccinia psidii MF-1 TaxID=1389203 RepID=A0A9Q3BMK3_9BASI|nr:hypothetical protein [Austropuccinia psidii MF-1]
MANLGPNLKIWPTRQYPVLGLHQFSTTLSASQGPITPVSISGTSGLPPFIRGFRPPTASTVYRPWTINHGLWSVGPVGPNFKIGQNVLTRPWPPSKSGSH